MSNPRLHYTDEDGGTVEILSTWRSTKSTDDASVSTDPIGYVEVSIQTTETLEIEVHSCFDS